MKKCYNCNEEVKISRSIKEGIKLNCLRCIGCGEEYFTSSELVKFDILRRRKFD